MRYGLTEEDRIFILKNNIKRLWC